MGRRTLFTFPVARCYDVDQRAAVPFRFALMAGANARHL